MTRIQFANLFPVTGQHGRTDGKSADDASGVFLQLMDQLRILLQGPPAKPPEAKAKPESDRERDEVDLPGQPEPKPPADTVANILTEAWNPWASSAVLSSQGSSQESEAPAGGGAGAVQPFAVLPPTATTGEIAVQAGPASPPQVQEDVPALAAAAKRPEADAASAGPVSPHGTRSDSLQRMPVSPENAVADLDPETHVEESVPPMSFSESRTVLGSDPQVASREPMVATRIAAAALLMPEGGPKTQERPTASEARPERPSSEAVADFLNALAPEPAGKTGMERVTHATGMPSDAENRPETAPAPPGKGAVYGPSGVKAKPEQPELEFGERKLYSSPPPVPNPLERASDAGHSFRVQETESHEAVQRFPSGVTIASDGKTMVQERASEVPPTRSPEFVFELAEHIRVQIREGDGQIRIQLRPEHLGHLEIKAETASGGVIARIMTESANVKSLLENNLHTLQQSLQDQGLKVDRIEVVLHEAFDNGRSGFAHDFNQSRPQHEPLPAVLEVPSETNVSPAPDRQVVYRPNSTFHAIA